jgi:hypothetical protein
MSLIFRQESVSVMGSKAIHEKHDSAVMCKIRTPLFDRREKTVVSRNLKSAVVIKALA